ncbi:hypothetical protein G9A89_012608 [Geosiphon pyriformis]|nr:hypothetical protein G9A89_012608 [Geosiphon pyriformis]
MTIIIYDVLLEILKHLDREDLLKACLINKEWCREGISQLWSDPFNSVVEIPLLKLLLSMVAKENPNDGYLTMIPYVTLEHILPRDTSYFNTLAATRPFSSPPPLYDYPSFVKFLNYSNLVVTAEEYCKDLYIGSKRPMVNEVVRGILKLFNDHNGHLKILHADQSMRAQHYDLWADENFAELLSPLNTLQLLAQTPKKNILGPSSKLFDAISTRSDTLKHLELNNVRLHPKPDWSFLQNFKKLTVLKVEDTKSDHRCNIQPYVPIGVLNYC